MFEIVFSALFNSFFMVRVVKGPWLRNPQYLAVALVGSVLTTLALQAYWPDIADDFVLGGLLSLAGSWGGMILFDVALAMA